MTEPNNRHDHIPATFDVNSLTMTTSLVNVTILTNTTRTGWVNEPNIRGSWSILLPCISTLLVCSWSVMHLNIPAKSSTNTDKFVPYLYWCFIGIFGPELAIWAAWRQLMSASALKREIEEAKVVTSLQVCLPLTCEAANFLPILSQSWFLCCYGRLRLRLQPVIRL